MVNARIEITQDLDGQPVVLACFDLSEADVARSAYAVAGARTERYRTRRWASTTYWPCAS